MVFQIEKVSITSADNKDESWHKCMGVQKFWNFPDNLKQPFHTQNFNIKVWPHVIPKVQSAYVGVAPAKLKSKPQIVWFMEEVWQSQILRTFLLAGDDAINSLSEEIIGDDAESRW